MKANKKRNLITDFAQGSPVSEEFKSLRTNIEFMSLGKPYHRILVTSAEPGSGKSTVSANLAIVCAQLGRKVLLIDTDFRKPTSHYTFAIRENVGLSNLLVTGLNIDEVCHETSIENLSVLTSGPVPPNSGELLASERMEDLLDELSSRYEQIIIDTPPVLAAADVLMLTPHVDGILLVFCDRHTNKEQAKRVVKQLQKTQTPIIGSVLNRVKGKTDGYYGYYK